MAIEIKERKHFKNDKEHIEHLKEVRDSHIEDNKKHVFKHKIKYTIIASLSALSLVVLALIIYLATQKPVQITLSATYYSTDSTGQLVQKDPGLHVANENTGDVIKIKADIVNPRTIKKVEWKIVTPITQYINVLEHQESDTVYMLRYINYCQDDKIEAIIKATYYDKVAQAICFLYKQG